MRPNQNLTLNFVRPTMVRYSDTSHEKFEVSEFQQRNLLRLADYLYSLSIEYEHFDMGEFYEVFGIYVEPDKLDNSKSSISCGTAACAIGHGPSAGIAIDGCTDWRRYAELNFAGRGDAFDWMFGTGWVFDDNSPQGAALRIYYALSFGIPSFQSMDVYEEQLDARIAMPEVLPLVC